MKTTFRHCLLVNYAMDPAVLARCLPRGLVPDTQQTRDGKKAFLSVVIADLEAMRPGFLPRAFGTDFTQVVYRAIVRAPNGERGVYFVRSDADDWTMSVFGSIFSNFNFNLARCVWAGRDVMRDAAALVLEQANDPSSRPEIQKREWLATPSLGDDRGERIRQFGASAGGSSSDGQTFAFMLEPLPDGFSDGEPAGVRLRLDARSATLSMPEPSAFAGLDVREAQRYFVELYAAFNSWPESDHWSAVRIDRTHWHVVALEPAEATAEFLQRSSNFSPGEVRYDSCLYVHALDYHWHGVDRQPFVLPEAELGGSEWGGVTTFFYDGGCPVCTREVAHWKRLLEASSDTKNELVLQDISGVGGVGSALGALGVSLEEAMARAHVIDATGTLHTGIPAFTHVWATLPYWKHLAWVLQTVPLAMSVAEVAYGVWSGARRHLQQVRVLLFQPLRWQTQRRVDSGFAQLRLRVIIPQ